MTTDSMAGLRVASIIAMGLGLVLVAIALYRWATGGSDLSALGSVPPSSAVFAI